MTAHGIVTDDENDGTVVLDCDTEGCEARFTIGSFAAATTRAAAASDGWRPARHGDRQDFCPDHAQPLPEVAR